MVAGGFQINEQGSRAMAMGGAYTAIANDASAVYFNNAAITRLQGFQLLIGTTVIVPSVSFRGPSPSVTETKMEKQTFTPSYAYLTYGITPNLYAGLGFNTPFGLGTQWDNNWVGRYSSTKTDLKTFGFNPTIAYKFNDVSVGAGLQYNFGNVTIEKAIAVAPSASSPALANGTVSLEGKTNSAIGFTAGLTWDVNNLLQLGLSYRSAVKYDFKGTSTPSLPSQYSSSAVVKSISAPLKTPQEVVVGAGYKVSPNILVSADFQYVGWSSYDNLTVNFDDGSTPSSSVRDYQNTWIARVGAEYKYSSNLALRAGLVYDKNPIKDERVDPSLPDASRLGFSGGIGYAISQSMNFDVSYLYLRFAERTITNSLTNYAPTGFAPLNGTYNSDASLISISLSYKF